MHFIKYLFCLSLLAILTSCGGNSACIDADDFGFKVVNVSARYDESEIIGTKENQIAPWRDFNLQLSGKVLLMMVKNWYFGEDLNNNKVMSAWCPWWGGSDEYSHILAPYCLRLRECDYINEERCHNPLIRNAPCLMKRGVGLYADLEVRGAQSPNASVATMSKPKGITMHLGEPTKNFRMYDVSGKNKIHVAGGVKYNYDGNSGLGSNRLRYVDGRLYLKILDTYYNDNNGQYTVIIKSGLQEPASDIFAIIKRLVQKKLFGDGDPDSPSLERNGVVRSIYENIVTAPGYHNAIRASLILYVMITGLLFLIGSISLTHTEVINRVIKISIISALMNPEVSWNFFNEYIFVWAYAGTAMIVQILAEAANTGPGDSSILTFLTSPQIMAKLASLLFSTWQGWIYIVIYLIMLTFLSIVLFDATIIYLSAQVMIGLLICLAPIFISFYLFDKTRSFFENWLKQLISYSIQCILISAGILFMTMIIRNQIYNTLGFRVCLEQFPDMNIAGGGLTSMLQGSGQGDGPVISLFAWWFPKIPGWGDNPIMDVIPIPKAHFKSAADAALGFGVTNSKDDSTGDFCSAYQCIGNRYPDLPFLDPNNKYEARQLDILRSGKVVDFGGLFVVVVCVFLLHNFNKTTSSIAQFLGSTSGNKGDNTKAASAASHTLMAPARMIADYVDRKSGFQGARNSIHNFWDKKVLGGTRSYFANKKAHKIEDQALNKTSAKLNSADQKLLDTVERKTGISQASAKEFQKNTASYEASLGNALKKSGNEGAAHDLVRHLGKHSSSDFQGALSKKLYGKEFNQLSKDQRDTVSGVMSDSSVQGMVNAKTKEELFKREYLQSYKDVLAEGKGGLARRTREKDRRARMADRNVSWEGEMKRYLSGGLLKNEAKEIQYNDPYLRTLEEKIRDKDDAIADSAIKKELDALTIKEGKDIQRPDFLGERRSEINAMQDSPDKKRMKEQLESYDELIEKKISSEMHQKLRESSGIMGDKYIREKMSDDEFDKMIDSVRSKGSALIDSDTYSQQEFMYKDNPAALAELHHRKNTMQWAVDDEVSRLRHVREDEQVDSTALGDLGKEVNKFNERIGRAAKDISSKFDKLKK